MTVEKQDGSFEPFKIEKVDKVISSAAKTAKVDITNYWFKNINDYVLSNCEKEAVDDKIKSEVIRTHIENALMLYNFFDVEKVFRDECNRRETVRLTKFKVFKEMQKILSQKKNKENQNANVDANSFCGKIGEADGAFLKNYALDYMMTPELARLHRYWYFYIHDLDRYAVGMHNCLSFPIDVIIKGATIKVPKALRDAGSVSTFCQLAMVHLQSQSMCQFGGVSLTHLDWSLVPYVRKSFWRYYREALKYQEKFTGTHEECQIQRFERTECSIDNPRYSNIKCKEIAWENTVREINQSMESLLHNANTLQSRSGNQLPFTSVNYGTCTKIEGQLAIEGILNAWEEGIGELHLTPIFPCGIFQLKDGINTKEGEPNYKYFRRALEILPKRDYPNFANADWEVDMAGFNKSQDVKRETLQSLDKETLCKIKSLPENVQRTLGFWINNELKLEMNKDPQPFEMMSTMGAVAGDEKVSVKINGEIFDNVSVLEAFNKITLDTRKKHNGSHKPTVKQYNGMCGVYKVTYVPVGVYYVGVSKDISQRFVEHRYSISHSGTVCEHIIGDMDLNNYKFEVLKLCDESEIVEAEQEFINLNDPLCLNEINSYRCPGNHTGKFKEKYSKKEYVSYTKFYDVCDCEIKSKEKWIPIRKVEYNNKDISLDLYAVTFENGTTIRMTEDHPLPTKRGRVCCDSLEIGDVCYTPEMNEIKIINKVKLTERFETFDFTTDNDMFDVSGILSHNCRTYNGFDINFTQDYFKHVLEETLKNYEQQQEELADIYKKLEVIEKLPVKNAQIYKEREALEELHDKVYNRIILPTRLLWSGNQKDGRGNIAPTTVMLPFIAMEAVKQAKKAKQSEYVVEFFMKQLEEMIGKAKDELIERYNWICAQSPDSAKYMYVENVTMLGGDDPAKNGLEPTMKHGTLAIGQVGLAETLEILIGCDQTTDKGMKLAEEIEQLFNRKCVEYKEHYKLNFGVYLTPAENLCFTSMKAFKKKYGKNIENVTYYTDENGERQDKKFFTNSIHVPVYKNDVSIFEKFLIESKLAKYSNAGCITYGEIDDETKNNVDALEEIVLYGKGLNLPYIALNFQINECTKCGGTDIDTEGLFCRLCGAGEKFINWLRRITGYLNGNYKLSFNEGKQDEVEKRRNHTSMIKWK